MATFTLPKNSKISEGKTYRAPAGAKNVKTFKVYRWDPDSGENPRLDTFEIDLDSCGSMVLFFGSVNVAISACLEKEAARAVARAEAAKAARGPCRALVQ